MFGLEKNLPNLSYGPGGKKIYNLDHIEKDITKAQERLNLAKSGLDEQSIKKAEKELEELNNLHIEAQKAQ